MDSSPKANVSLPLEMYHSLVMELGLAEVTVPRRSTATEHKALHPALQQRRLPRNTYSPPSQIVSSTPQHA